MRFAFFLFRLFLNLIALFTQDPNPDFDIDPNVLAAGDLKLNFNGLSLPFFLDNSSESELLTLKVKGFESLTFLVICQLSSPFHFCVHLNHDLADRNYGKHFCSNA